MRSNLTVYFGDSDDEIIKEYKKNISSMDTLLYRKNIKSLYAVQQIHGINHVVLDEVEDGSHVLAQEADILITNKKNIGIGVFTADCVPLLLYAPDKEVIAAVHAGWKGAVKGVAARAVDLLIENFGIGSKKLQAFIGPSIHLPCFEVGNEVIDQVKETSYERLSLYVGKEDGKTRCDLVELNIQFLLSRGCLFRNINRRESFCTVCIPTYHSSRRNGKQSMGRQISFIALK
ncbi:polyphenol oxidase family protein [Candidatus Babeliales bacterium]|nr:polyphenol oxidase family protein [Candidatus Babeliales bacterium]